MSPELNQSPKTGSTEKVPPIVIYSYQPSNYLIGRLTGPALKANPSDNTLSAQTGEHFYIIIMGVEGREGKSADRNKSPVDANPLPVPPRI